MRAIIRSIILVCIIVLLPVFKLITWTYTIATWILLNESLKHGNSLNRTWWYWLLCRHTSTFCHFFQTNNSLINHK